YYGYSHLYDDHGTFYDDCGALYYGYSHLYDDHGTFYDDCGALYYGYGHLYNDCRTLYYDYSHLYYDCGTLYDDHAAIPTTTPVPPPKPINQVCRTAIWSSNFTVLTGTGIKYSNATQLSQPTHIIFDSRQNMYIVDEFNHAVQRLSPSLNTSITVAGISTSSGMSLSELRSPTALFITPDDIMYIADNGNNRILKWRMGEPHGIIVAGGFGPGSAPNQISTCYGIYVDAQSNIYVSDYGNHRVVIWSAGNATSGRRVAGGNGFGTAENQLHSPYGIYVDKKGILYIVEQGN
ncbi:unnamed protein product, partial [Rotaria socialis]